MSQLNFFKYTTVGLLVLNVSMIAFFFLTKPRPPLNEGSAHHRVVKLLDLDKAQGEKFFQSARNHHDQLPLIEDRQKEALQTYFNSLLSAPDSIDLAPALEKIVQLERQKVVLTYQHFEEIRGMLKPEQVPKFESFMGEVLKTLLLPKSRGKH
ncbi:MAG: hypothetical protein AAF985_10305 [Bacteroidota bacterium]